VSFFLMQKKEENGHSFQQKVKAFEHFLPNYLKNLLQRLKKNFQRFKNLLQRLNKKSKRFKNSNTRWQQLPNLPSVVGVVVHQI